MNATIPGDPASKLQQVVICRYGSRYWAVHQGTELIAVTLYKKGALRVAQLLTVTPEEPIKSPR